jgi:hypothetical protein
MLPVSALPTSTSTLPSFFIVGAPKSGTTSLYHYLDQHPEVFMSPIKEPNYFATEIRAENFADELREQVDKDLQELQGYLRGPMHEKRFGGLVSEWADYLKLFENAKTEKALGEASVCYLWSRNAAAKIHSRIPDAKIIIVLRDPSEVAFSLYLQSVAEGLIRGSFRKTIEASLRGRSQKFSLLHPFLELGLYCNQVKRFLQRFPRQNVLILFYEEFRKQQAQAMAEIFRFLDVDAGFETNTSQRYLEPRVPRFIATTCLLKKSGVWGRASRWTPKPLRPWLRRLSYRPRAAIAMDSNDREYLIEYYRNDVEELAILLDRDLSAWLH